jgi:peptidyl-tRNA hydrolase
MIEPRLYIIMREDIPDMNPGKGMAQAAHAQADMIEYMNTLEDYGVSEMVKLWREDRSFGTTTVLSAELIDIQEMVNKIEHSGLTVDPSYPWRNFYGMPFVTEEVTAAWAFVFDQKEREWMKGFNLHE